MNRTFVTVGAGQSAAVAARTLRRQGFDGAILLVGDERRLPYQRPPLSKGFLAGTEGAEDLSLLDAQWCAANEVDVRIGTRVTRLMPADRSLELSDGSAIVADAVLFATGVRPRPLHCEATGRIVYLRTIDDAQRLRGYLSPGRRIITVGGGFIGAEVAASARVRGADVTVLEMAEVPLAHALGPEMGEVCAAIHRDNGVSLLTGERVVAVTETADAVTVQTESGLAVEGDLVVAGIGAIPNAELAADAGIAVGDGILVDEFGRTSVPGVFAAGDVANHYHPATRERIRVEHFDNASRQAAATARAMLGKLSPYNDIHWFWSDQYEHNMQYAGHVQHGSDVVIRGSVPDRCFTAFYLSHGVVKAAFAIDRGEDITWAKELISAGADPEPAKLRDEDIDLAELIPLT